MAKKRIPKLSTIRTNISHIRKMISRLDAMKEYAPTDAEIAKMEKMEVKQFGSRLIIDGKTYTPKELEAMKDKQAWWQVKAIKELETKLAEQQYMLIQRGSKPKKTEALSTLERSHAEEGLEMITDPQLISFDEWLNNEVSDGIRKKWYYHEYGAKTINRGDYRGFLEFMSFQTGEEIKNLEDLTNVFRTHVL